jgi:tetratricopeptide (TPR) repeat protein
MAEDFIEAGNESYQSKHYESALNWYMRSIIMEPNQVQGWLKIGQTYDALSDYDRALDAYQKAWNIEPENSMLSYVNSLVKNEHIETAVDVLREALSSQTQSTNRLEWWKELGSLFRLNKIGMEQCKLIKMPWLSFQMILVFTLNWGGVTTAEGRNDFSTGRVQESHEY